MSEKQNLNQNKVYLIGSTIEQLNVSSLPTNNQVLSRFFHCLRFEKKTMKISSSETAEEVLISWGQADIPTITKRGVTKRIMKLWEKWLSLHKNKKLQTANQKCKENIFQKKLSLLFDISIKELKSLMKNSRKDPPKYSPLQIIFT